MAVYRVYLVHDDGRLEADEHFYCGSDAEALSQLSPSPVSDVRTELWQGGRFIGAARPRFDADAEREAPRYPT